MSEEPTNIRNAVIEQVAGQAVTIALDGERHELPLADVGDKATVGATVEVYVDRDGGKPFVSHRMAAALATWDAVARAATANADVEGEIVALVKGGLSVDVGMRAFLPASQVALRHVEDLAPLVGQKVRVRVLELDNRRGRVVVSRRAVLESERAVQRTQQLQTMHVGDVVSGTVVSFVNYGAFVDLGGLDGLLRHEDMSWGHVRHGTQVFAEGQIIQAKVLEVDVAKGRVALGVKQLTPDPWHGAHARYPVGKRVSATVLRLTDFGAFVEIEPNVEALLHVSEMRWGKPVRHPGDVVQKGQAIEAVVLDVDTSERRMSLGMKQLTEDPWITATRPLAVDSRVTGKVTGVTEFGAFVEVAPGIQGLCHVTELTEDRDQRPADVVKIGDTLTVVVLDVDTESQRIALSVLAAQEKAAPETSKERFTNSMADKLRGLTVKE